MKGLEIIAHVHEYPMVSRQNLKICEIIRDAMCEKEHQM